MCNEMLPERRSGKKNRRNRKGDRLKRKAYGQALLVTYHTGYRTEPNTKLYLQLLLCYLAFTYITDLPIQIYHS